MKGFFPRWLLRSLRGTLASGFVATASLGLCAALVSCLVTISEGVEARLGEELRSYGANLLLLPRLAPLRFGLGAFELGAVEDERWLPAADLARLPSELVEVVAPALMVRVALAGGEVGAVGYDLAALRRLNPYWRVAPGWPDQDGQALAGASVAARLSLRPGQELVLVAGDRTARVRLRGIVETGGSEDEGLLLPLGVAQALAGQPGQLSFALLRGRLAGREPGAVARALEQAVPGAEVRTLRQVAQAEASLLATVRRLLLLVTLALGAATAFTVAGTLGVLLHARRQELGLCLALGAAPATLRRLLLGEAAAAGLLGGLAGSGVGALAAQAVARSVFGAFVPFAPAAAPLALGAALGVALLSSLWPVRQALRVSPCDTLRAS